MARGKNLVKHTASILVPILLFALLIFQIYRCKNILVLRNSYLLESLPESSDWIWDTLSGRVQAQTFAKDVVKAKGEIDDESDSVTVPKVWQQNEQSAVLQSGIPSLTVHYLWCVDGHFELSHYILILSIIDQLQPDKIVLHYRTKPRPDPQGYWRWLEDLQRNVVMLSLRPLSNPRHCRHDLSAGVSHDSQDFPDPHGVYILGDVAVTNLSRAHVVKLMINSFSLRKRPSPVKQLPPPSAKELGNSQVFLVADTEPYHMSQSPGRVVISCPSITTVNSQKEEVKDVHCLNINTYISPEELFRQNSQFHRLARSLMYGSPDPVEAKLASREQIPNNVHIVVMEGDGEITPVLYLSIKSAFINGQAVEVYIHGPNDPKGQLWDQLHSHDDLKIRYVPTASPQQLGGKDAAMIYGLYTLLQHGGILHFGDFVFLSSIPSSSRCARAIATPHFSQYRLKHRSTNTAILAGAIGSEFVKSMLARMRQQDPTWSTTRADDVATHVSETNPESVLLDLKLTSHQRCSLRGCRVEGGHQSPQQAYTTRVVWEGDKKPSSLEQLKNIEGPTRKEFKDIIESSHIGSNQHSP